ncbi:hypothetical protein QBC37DRAFT_202560 [Rhypophila decipiens]|uniref:NAD(+) ADP-ribosyltransferase n=1 Tax=Rhypophila decipiens TaxID=261697 RepID=A0AAN6Y3L9_9PEZI|nr:hypothetical protein QBC37DRAFT_202560 [Rhypophila decipiens]
MAAQSGGDMQVVPESDGCPLPFAINPGKLHAATGTAPGDSSGAQSKDATGLKRMTSSIMARPQPVPRISSFWDPKRGHLPEDWERPCWKKECLAYDAVPDGWQTFYFSLSDSYPICVPTDPAVFPPSHTVHLDRDSQSIYDAYLLKSDITDNVNEFRRLQVLYDGDKYVFFERFGRAGLLGDLDKPARPSASSQLVAGWHDSCSNSMVEVFKNRFESLTGTRWEHRYLAEPVSVSQYPLRDHYIYVDQDYSRYQQVKLVDHEALATMARMDESTSFLMENILYGDGASRSRTCHNTVNASPSVSSSNSFTAPFHCLSIRTIAQAFQTLKRITFYLGSDDLPEQDRNSNEKPRVLRWTTLAAASSCYRSQIPSWHGPGNSARPLVISNHYLLFLELEFLHNLNPQNPPLGLEDFKNTVGHKGNPQAWEWGARGGVRRRSAKAAPLMQAYSSLPHGFRLLPGTGSTALEFRELKAYLENSCQTHEHRMQFEIESIYRVYTKATVKNPYHEWLRKTRDDQLPAADSREPPRRNRVLLWHGTPLSSLFGILEKGLQIYKRCPDPPPDPPARQPAPPQAPGNQFAFMRTGQLTTQRNAAMAARNTHLSVPSQPTTNAAPSAAFQAQVQRQAQQQQAAVMQAQKQHLALMQARMQAQRQAQRQAQQQQMLAALAATALPAAPMTQTNKRRRLLGNQPPPAPPPPQVTQLPAWMLQIPPQMPPRAPAMNMIPPGGSTMFGDGIYLADASSKSANYCSPRRNLCTGPSEVYAILLLCEADVGSPSERHRSRHSMPHGHVFVQEKREWEEDKRRRTEELKDVVYVDDAPTLRTLGNGVRSIQGVGKVGPKDGPEGWKKVPWRLDWDWKGHDGEQERGQANDYGDVWMPDTSRPYPTSTDGNYYLQFNEYVLYDPSHVQIRYIFRVRVKGPY